MGINWRLGIIKIEWWIGIGQFQIGLIKRPYRPNILPVPIEVKAIYLMRFDSFRDDVPAEIVKPCMVLEQIDQYLCIEHINPHGTKKWPFFIVLTADKLPLDFRVFGLLNKIRDPTICFFF